MTTAEILLARMKESERKAIDNLARYKFSNFGYWAAAWVRDNQLLKQISGTSRPSPFRPLVVRAMEMNE